MAIKILIINPNSTASMTADIGKTAQAYALPETLIVAINPPDGPASIQGPEDGIACLPGLFKIFNRAVEVDEYDAIILACFDDTGLQELKSKAKIPVLGIGEAAFHAAAMLGRSFSTVTTLAVSVPVIERNIARYGFAGQSKKVRASQVPVLEVGNATRDIIRQEAKRAILDDKCDSIVLGCAGMADLADTLSQELDHTVIDGVVAAVGFCEALCRKRST